jgi:predicted hydrocarbon binding protein
MKGVVFNLLEEAIGSQHGEETWDALLEATGLEGSYTSLGSYPDEHLIELVRAASAKLGKSPEELVRWFGRSALPLLAERYAHFFEPHRSTRDFLLTLNDIIHPEVRKIYPGAEVPVFTYYPAPEAVLIMGYRSSRKLCHFGEGLIEGAAAHFGDDVTVEQLKCTRRGDPECLYWVSFADGERSGNDEP